MAIVHSVIAESGYPLPRQGGVGPGPHPALVLFGLLAHLHSSLGLRPVHLYPLLQCSFPP